MHTINDTRKLAQLLLKDKKIDREGFDHIVYRLSETEKAKASSRASGNKSQIHTNGDAKAISFIAELKVKMFGNKDKTITDEDILKSLSSQFNIPYKKLDPLDLDIDIVTRTIPKPYALKHMILPLYEKEGELYVAIIDPESQDTIDGLAHVTGKKIRPVLATPDDIMRIVHEFFGFKASVINAEKEMHGQKIDLGNLEQLNRIKRPDEIGSNDHHIKNAVEYLFNYAFKLRASDIHIEPKRETSIVRFRIDGSLNDVYTIPKGVYQAIASRIKMLARLNIAEKRRPQDGRIKIEHGEGTAEIRLSTMPTAFGEKLVLRVLKAEFLLRDLESLGFFPEDQIKMEKFLNCPHGIVLVTGPTGSGKTTTLYSALGFLSHPEKNIISIEDPIETICDSFNQVAVQPAIGLTFAASLRTILRQDPDIIMIGEIRDSETAENAIQAALTGHLVLSTLHTNDTTSTITRLFDLGVEPYQINSAVIGIVAQRLVKMICPDCIKTIPIDKEKLAIFGVKTDKKSVEIKEGYGCEKCRFTGYYGRTSVYEVLEINSAIRTMIHQNKTSMEIRKYALESGMTTLRDSAVRKMLNGVTTMAEVLRIGYEL